MKSKEHILHTPDNFEISVVHTKSSSASNKIVLWFHGIGVNKNEYLDFFKEGSEYLCDKEIDSLRIDFRGHGTSSGSSQDFTIAGQIIDAETSLKYILNNYTNAEICIVGCSFGAFPALFLFSKFHNIIKSLVLIAPVLSYKLTFLDPLTDWGKSLFNKKTIEKLEDTNKLFIGDNFAISMKLYAEMQIIDSRIIINSIQKSFQVIHGDADSIVDCEISKIFANEYPLLKLVVFNEMEHGFTKYDDDAGVTEDSKNNKKNIFRIIENSYVNEN